MLRRAVALGRTDDLHTVEIRPLGIGRAMVSTLLDEALEFTGLDELPDRALHSAHVGVRILGERLHRRPCTAVALVVGDAEKHEFRGPCGG